MGNDTRFYNVLFPLWFLLIFPVTWLVVLPANFLIDSAVLLVTLKVLKTVPLWSSYKQIILKTWLLGFLADFFGAGFMFLTQLNIFASKSRLGDWWFHHITNPVAYNPFDNLYSLLYVGLAVALTGVLIYFFNLRFALKNWDADPAIKRKIALSLAICTAPYIFFYPSRLLY